MTRPCQAGHSQGQTMGGQKRRERVGGLTKANQRPILGLARSRTDKGPIRQGTETHINTHKKPPCIQDYNEQRRNNQDVMLKLIVLELFVRGYVRVDHVRIDQS